TLDQVRQSLTVAPASLSKRSALVRNTGRSRSSTWRAFGTGFITQMNTWEKSYCRSIDPTKRWSSSQHRYQRGRLTLRRGRLPRRSDQVRRVHDTIRHQEVVARRL